jgi:AcrR family transcriptional regulator
MAEEQQPKRRYNSTRRQAQAAETRRQIVEAARGLFAEHGYAGTTMEMLARASGVAVETVYAIFGNKRAILARLVDVSVGGDEAPVALLDRAGPQALLRERDQRRQVRMFAHGIREIMERMSPIFEILRIAAKTEPDIALLLQRLLQERLQGMMFFVQAVRNNGPLRPEVNELNAAETAWAVSSAEMYRLLTVDRAWSGDQ